MIISINSCNICGTLTKLPEIDVIATHEGGGHTVVKLNIVYDHPHDMKKRKGRRPNYVTIRLYGKTAEAAAKNLQRGDEVLVINASIVQDCWEDKTTKLLVRRYYLEPPPMGLKYLRVRKLGIGHPFPTSKKDDHTKEPE